MSLDLNFNDPRILRAYLDQSLPQMALQTEEDRFVVGDKEGGLAYRLFGKDAVMGFNRCLPAHFRISNSGEANGIVRFFREIDDYIDGARTDAEQYGCDLVDVSGDKIKRYDGKSSVYSVGVGRIIIPTEAIFGSLLQLVADAKDTWQKRQDEIMKAAEDLFKDRS